MKRPIINVDLDGCVFDFAGTFRAYCQEYLERELPYPTTWEFWNDWDITEDEWFALFRDAVHDGLWIDPSGIIPGAREALRELSDREFHIRILTTRLVHQREYEVAAEDTIRWLESHRIPYRSLAIIGKGDDKTHYEASVIIDDHYPNVEKFVRIPGRMGIIFDQPWNRDTTAPQSSKVVRAQGWSEVLQVRELWPK